MRRLHHERARAHESEGARLLRLRDARTEGMSAPDFLELAQDWLVRATGHATPGRDASLAAELRKVYEMRPGLDFVFDEPPGLVGPRLLDVEVGGTSVRAGAWVERPDGTWVLRLAAMRSIGLPFVDVR
jgi:hypothetical protein